MNENHTIGGSLNLPGGGGSDIYLAKYSPSGQFIWARAAGGPNGEGGEGVAVDGAGNAYVTGVFVSQASFGPNSSGLYVPITGLGSQDCFLAKYSSTGTLLWVDSTSGQIGDYSAQGRGVAVDPSGKAWITGIFSGNARFGMNMVLGAGYANAFVAHYDHSLFGWIWARQTSCANNLCGN
ncbi:MAG: hypothetical protein NTW03_14445, partial [Verrucomicrobia bacterium]|nr:hypothetical protein [Verrucomicrobiota bacterium]